MDNLQRAVGPGIQIGWSPPSKEDQKKARGETSSCAFIENGNKTHLQLEARNSTSCSPLHCSYPTSTETNVDGIGQSALTDTVREI